MVLDTLIQFKLLCLSAVLTSYALVAKGAALGTDLRQGRRPKGYAACHHGGSRIEARSPGGGLGAAAGYRLSIQRAKHCWSCDSHTFRLLPVAL